MNLKLKQIGAFAAAMLSIVATAAEPTKASESVYERDITKATTSDGLSKADLAWHAKNTYGWKCDEVVTVGLLTSEGYFPISCSSGIKLRVYPRAKQHPRITNAKGTYK